MATLVVGAGRELDVAGLTAIVTRLRPEQRPGLVRLRDAVAMTDGFRPLNTSLELEGIEAGDRRLLIWDGREFSGNAG